jgi:hypothetical protein
MVLKKGYSSTAVTSIPVFLRVALDDAIMWARSVVGLVWKLPSGELSWESESSCDAVWRFGNSILVGACSDTASCYSIDGPRMARTQEEQWFRWHCLLVGPLLIWGQVSLLASAAGGR